MKRGSSAEQVPRRSSFPSRHAGELLEPAARQFTQGLQVAGLTSAVIAAGTAVER